MVFFKNKIYDKEQIYFNEQIFNQGEIQCPTPPITTYYVILMFMAIVVKVIHLDSTANFPFIKTLDDFEFGFQPGINRKEMLELGNLGFVDRKENILFVGSSGVGKTHLAIAV